MPLVLGGCGLPIGIQIASLLADGVSFITTDKTLTDHGISAVANKDCAIWCGLKGDDICRNADLDALSVAAADEPMPDETIEPTEIQPQIAAAEEWTVEEDDAPLFAASSDVDETETTVPPVPVSVIETASVSVVPPVPPVPPVPTVKETSPEPAVEASLVKRQGGTFLIIASYHRAGDAERFARAQSTLDAIVLAGRAKGRNVFRVAIGPVAKADRADARTDLVKAGFGDVWVLRQSKPEIIVQLASVD